MNRHVPRYVAATRPTYRRKNGVQVEGIEGVVQYASGKTVARCFHHHAKKATAEVCARRLLRQVNREGAPRASRR